LLSETRRLVTRICTLADRIAQEYPHTSDPQRISTIRELAQIAVTTAQRVAEALDQYQIPMHPVDEDYLQAVRHDLLSPIGGINGSVMILAHMAHQDADLVTQLCQQRIDELVRTGNDLGELLDALCASS